MSTAVIIRSSSRKATIRILTRLIKVSPVYQDNGIIFIKGKTKRKPHCRNNSKCNRKTKENHTVGTIQNLIEKQKKTTVSEQFKI